jgi:hypothetical protein
LGTIVAPDMLLARIATGRTQVVIASATVPAAAAITAVQADNPVTCLKVQNARLRLRDHAAWHVAGQEWEPDISPNAFDGLVTSRTNATRFDFHEYAAGRFGCGATHLLGTQAIRSVHNGGEHPENDFLNTEPAYNTVWVASWHLNTPVPMIERAAT